MTTIEKIPQAVLEILDKKGIGKEKIVCFFRSDVTPDFVYADVFLICTADTLAVLTGSCVFGGIKNGRRPVLSYTESDYAEYDLKKLGSFACDRNISFGLFSAEYEGERIGLARYSLSLQNKAFGFRREVEKLAENGELSEEDKNDKDEELCCPKCGCRYADPKRKICPQCMDKAKLVKRLSLFFKKYRLYTLFSLLSLIFMTACSTILPYIKGSVYYDDVLSVGGSRYGQLWWIVLVIVGTKILQTLSNTVNSVVTSRIAAKVVYDIKKTVFTAISRLSYGFFTSRQTGGLMTSVNNDANSIYSFFCDGLPYLVINVVQLVSVTAIMLSINPVLTLIAFATVPVFLIVYRSVLAAFDKLYAKNFSRHRAFNSLITDVLTGIRVVKSFAREDSENARFEDRSTALAESHKTIGTLNSSIFPLINYMFYLGHYALLAFGGWLVMHGNMTYGTLMTFIGYVGMIYEPLYFFADVSRWWAECMNSIQRVFEILDSVPEVAESESPTPLPAPRGDVVFSHVSFGYDKTRKVLDDIDFSIKAGETIGIVGETGAGKSTLVNLLIRLYDTDEGDITIDGINVRDLSFHDLHRCVAIVSQETYLFRGTILENIRYAKPDATDEEVYRAARMADAHRFIIRYPEGYETLIGRGNKQLSGGECQRISIARAILKDPTILILDEATSAMDTGTERHIQQALNVLSRGRTTIMIAHRLSTLRDADRLVVIDNGKMPEYGTHRELLDLKGIYYNLHRLQAEALKSIGIE